MTLIVDRAPSGDEDDDELGSSLSLPGDSAIVRPDLTEEFGIDEVQRGVCLDTFENRRTIRRAGYTWEAVWTVSGKPTGLIAVRSKDMESRRSMIAIEQRREIMVDPTDYNSDYLTGLDLLVESAADLIVPPWVLGATRYWVHEQENGPVPGSKKRAVLPGRCRALKPDGVRCLLWHSGREKDDGMCTIHVRTFKKSQDRPTALAREKLAQAAPYAADTLEELMLEATSEPVRLKASTEILDRVGIRGGVEIDANVEVKETRPAAEIVLERLNRLAGSAAVTAGILEAAGTVPQSDPNPDVVDAEVVDDDDATR